MKKIFKKLLAPLRKINNIFFDGYSIKSYSQEGEDMILRRIFEKTPKGFYVDVGAHHPKRFSNTYFFYKRGWTGINIGAMPGSMKLFQQHRNRDINLEIPIASKDQTLTFFSFNEPALNSFSRELSKERDGQNGCFIKDEILLQTQKLSSVLDNFLPNGTKIDFLSIDVEGFDLDILYSNNWAKYKPRVILIEILGSSLAEIKYNEIAVFLKAKRYSLFAKAVHTFIFILNEFDGI
ncbi:Methyltransferase FkbM [Candidatus Methylopumilus universalis]|uniref:FkbM family methyltransferase n=1 Tax=Candidatus Methylopumilus universalis TaxID=2588536 RepID=UPI003BEEF051